MQVNSRNEGVHVAGANRAVVNSTRVHTWPGRTHQYSIERAWRAGGIKGAAHMREVDANRARTGHEDIRWVARPDPRASARGLHHTGARVKAWCLSIHAEASFSLSLSQQHGGLYVANRAVCNSPYLSARRPPRRCCQPWQCQTCPSPHPCCQSWRGSGFPWPLPCRPSRHPCRP